MRKVVIVGPPPAQILDVAGPLEVFSSARDYEVVLGNPGLERTLRTNRNIALTDALPIHEITGTIDTLVIAGGPGAGSGSYDPEFVAWIADAAKRSRRIASICTGTFLLGAAGLIDGRNVVTHWKFCDRLASFYTNGGCKQPASVPASVLLVVGENGEYLGNDNYDNAADKTGEWTPGMHENPQLGQSSGWHLGLAAIDWVE